MGIGLADGGGAGGHMSLVMIQPVSTPQQLPSQSRRTLLLAPFAAGTAAAMVLAGALALWAHYGTAVFFEMIVSGLEACF
jgi:hypothetical protein